MEKQVSLIRKFFKLTDGETMILHGSVDSNDDNIRELMRNEWLRLDVMPYDLPKHRSSCGSTSYGIAFQFVYDNFIKKNDYISIFMENDIFPISTIEINKYVENYALCSDIRIAHIFGTVQIPQVWLGLLFFNHLNFKDKDTFSGLKSIIHCENGKSFMSDCGGESYYWVSKNKKLIKCIKQTHHPENYNHFDDHPYLDAYDIPNCKMVDFLPEFLKDRYDDSFRVQNYENKFIHLLSFLGKQHSIEKLNWFENVYNKLIQTLI